MVLESVPVLSTAYLMIIVGVLLLVAGYYYRTRDWSQYLLVSGAILITLGIGLIAYFISSFG